jgi:tRNA modification GTPase
VSEPTLVSVLTPPGRGAVAVAAVAGPRAVAAVDACFLSGTGRKLAKAPLNRILYGHWKSPAGEDLVAVRRGADRVEVHSHGGWKSSQTIVADLLAAGCQENDWQAWIGQTEQSSIAAAARIALAEALTTRTAMRLLDQYHGALEAELRAVLSEFSSPDPTSGIARLERLLARGRYGLHLTRPWRVVVAGLPNVGKSSLVNALLGYGRAIVFDLPGTTRDAVSAATAIDGWPVSLTDTAGLRVSSDEIEQAGIARAKEKLSAAELVLWVVDATELAPGQSVAELAATQTESLAVEVPAVSTLLVVNKIDLAPKCRDDSDAIYVSAKHGDGIDRSLQAIADHLTPDDMPPGVGIPFTEGQVEMLARAHQACLESNFTTVAHALRNWIWNVGG